ncbi:hypothetical protein [Acetobacterium sp. KB-1]|uniref:hypothetical protein n=1 Tax=Acetobacterium sp. KB-1 TaxID=2184575 RepID=UPI000DBEC492|nr:hypothetical protein [Acetobacterium sp. KB-1]AWW26576.1 hypothetical protein DOZ58_07905 [Acetobacterium sp. KB-1]
MEAADENLSEIRGEMDYPVLYGAEVGERDHSTTGDKDFADIDIEKLEMPTASEFVGKYVHVSEYRWRGE